ncbi:MAG: hypothetical protein KC933_21215 [Myxococcales bacterium]|nr:hypothetical protein [Myxococcales bacterium]MCB9647755.1 hypothetical protein [Deltaproteobacteria bacterium]
MRTTTALAPLIITLALAGPAAAEDDKAIRRLRHEVDQALLYVNMNLPDRAVESLQALVEKDPGKTDGLTWLALGKALYGQQKLDDAGAAVAQAEVLGVKDHLDEAKWARAFLEEFKENLGSVRIRDATCPYVKFPAKLAVPIVNRKKRALLEALPGWRKKELERSTERAFYLPVGEFMLAETKVKVIAGEETAVTAQEIGAVCTALPQLAVTPGTGAVTGSGPGAGQQQPSFMADNWWWIVLGAVAVAGGTTAAVVVATQDSGPQKFHQVF